MPLITINSQLIQIKRQVITFILFNIKDDKIKQATVILPCLASCRQVEAGLSSG